MTKKSPTTGRFRSSLLQTLVSVLLASGCRPTQQPTMVRVAPPILEPKSNGPTTDARAQRPPTEEQAPAPSNGSATAEPEGPSSEEAWYRTRLPEGGTIERDERGSIRIVHIVRPRDTFSAISEQYLDLTTFYLADELATALRNQAGFPRGRPPEKGTRLVIPGLLSPATHEKWAARLRWPADKVLRGLYVRGVTAGGKNYQSLLQRMVDRGLNLIVLDSKDYDGWLTYASKVSVAVESGAVLKNPPIRSLARTIQFAHSRGILVAVRISCFEDEVVAKVRGDLSVQAIWGRPYKIGWLDPSNEGAQQYLLDLAKEAIEAGADEIQLDYVRYPVLGIKGADFNLEKRGLTKTGVITGFVRKMHTLTHAHDVPLSLDVFGIIADGKRADIDNLGQDPVLLAPECEAISPMVYPSHYRPGYWGFEVPGNHPEIAGIGTRKIIAQIRDAHVQSPAVIRPWLQAASWNTPEYGPQWLSDEVHSAEGGGATGWLMWNPAQTYTVTWRAVPVSSASAGASPTATSSTGASPTATSSAGAPSPSPEATSSAGAPRAATSSAGASAGATMLPPTAAPAASAIPSIAASASMAAPLGVTSSLPSATPLASAASSSSASAVSSSAAR